MSENKQEPKSQGLYNIELGSEYLGGVSPHTLRKKIQSGEIGVVRLGKRTMLSQAELDRISRQGWSPLSHTEVRGHAS